MSTKSSDGCNNRAIVAKDDDYDPTKMITEEELHWLHETILIADHQHYRRIRVNNDFQAAVSLLNLAFSLPSPLSGSSEEDQQTTAHENADEELSSSWKTLSTSLWCRAFLLKLFSVESELMRRISKKQDLGIQLEAYQEFREDYQWYSQYLFLSATSPSMAASMRMEWQQNQQQKMKEIDGDKKEVVLWLTQDKQNKKTINVPTSSSSHQRKNNNHQRRRPFETLLEEICPESILYGTKTGRTIKYRRNTDTNNTDGLSEVQYEETNPTCVLNRLEQLFCDAVAKDVIKELEALLGRLEYYMRHRERHLHGDKIRFESSQQEMKSDEGTELDNKTEEKPTHKEEQQRGEEWQRYLFQHRSIPLTAYCQTNPFSHSHPYRKPLDDKAAQLILYIHFFLGVVQLNGLGCRIDSFSAFQHFLFAGDLGLDLSQGEVGHMYDTDNPFLYDLELGWEKEAARTPIEDDRDNQCGESKEGKEVVEKQSEKKPRVIDVSSYTMDNVSYRFPTYLSTGNNESAESRLKRTHQYLACFYYSLSANQGYAITQSIYALLMETIDIKKSIEYYRKAAEQGLREAVFNLGNCHFFGSGVPIDYAFAFQCFQKGCTLGDPDAILSLAECYSHGLGVEQDNEKAIYYYRIAAEKGENAMAMYNLGAMYFNGMGIEASPKESFEWFYRAAKLDYPLAMQRVGVCFMYGIGVQEDQELATKYFLQAANAGLEQSYLLVARRFALGQGVEKDFAIAFHFLCLGADIIPSTENNVDETAIAQARVLLRTTAYSQAWSIRYRGPKSLAEVQLTAE